MHTEEHTVRLTNGDSTVWWVEPKHFNSTSVLSQRRDNVRFPISHEQQEHSLILRKKARK